MTGSLWAVHIADGFLQPSWLAAGALVALGLALVGAWGIREEEIPRVALLTAVFFIASQLHVALGPSTAHLLLNGLLGVILGRRALLAIPVGLGLQAILFGHGGFSSLGVNSCVMSIPALAAWALFGVLNRVRWTRHQLARSALVGLTAAVWTFCVVYGFVLLSGTSLNDLAAATHAAAAIGILGVTVAAVALERRLERSPEFAIGLCVGVSVVLLTLGLHCAVLLLGSNQAVGGETVAVEAERFGIGGPQQPWRILAAVVLLTHLPVAALEGLILGLLVGFLARVKPELVGHVGQGTPCTAQHAA